MTTTSPRRRPRVASTRPRRRRPVTPCDRVLANELDRSRVDLVALTALMYGLGAAFRLVRMQHLEREHRDGTARAAGTAPGQRPMTPMHVEDWVAYA